MAGLRVNIVVFTPLRVASQVDSLMRHVRTIYSGSCSVDYTIVPKPEPLSNVEVVVEGSVYCASLIHDIVALATGSKPLLRISNAHQDMLNIFSIQSRVEAFAEA